MAPATQNNEQGGVAVVVAMMAVVLTSFMFVVLHAGKLLIARQEARGAADALALTAAAALRQQGEEGGGLDLEAIKPALLRGNTKHGFSARVAMVRDHDKNVVQIEVEVSGEYKTPWAAAFGGGALAIRAKSHAAVGEWGYPTDNGGVTWPSLVVTLDASGSMNQPLDPSLGYGPRPGQGEPIGGRCSTYTRWSCANDNLYCDRATRKCAACPIDRFNCDGRSECEATSKCPPRTPYALLSGLVEAYAAEPFPVRTGVVVFNDEVVSAVAPPQGNRSNVAAVRDALRGVTPTGKTNIGAALVRARRMLGSSADTVVMVTDGMPTAGGSFWFWRDSHADVARKAAAAVRGGAEGSPPAHLFCVETQPAHGGQSRFMTQLAGGPGSGGDDPNFYYPVRLIDDVVAFLRAMAHRACAFGPLPGTPDKDHERTTVAFLRDGDGDEEKLTKVSFDEIGTSSSTSAWAYNKTKSGHYVLLSKRTCNRVAREGYAVVARYGGLRLAPPPGAQTILDVN